MISNVSINPVYIGIHLCVFAYLKLYPNTSNDGVVSHKRPFWGSCYVYALFAMGTVNIVCTAAFVYETQSMGRETSKRTSAWKPLKEICRPVHALVRVSVIPLLLVQDVVSVREIIPEIVGFCLKTRVVL